MLFQKLTAIVGALLMVAAASHAAEPAIITLNDTNEPPLTQPDQRGFLDRVAAEAFRRVGAKLQLVKLPAERGLINANAGIIDGDLNRIREIGAQYPNLIRVPEKIFDANFSAYSKDRSIRSSWSDIRQRAVGYIRGWKIFEQQLADAPNVTTAENAEQLFNLLALDRIEVALYDRWVGEAQARQQGIEGVYALTPPRGNA